MVFISINKEITVKQFLQTFNEALPSLSVEFVANKYNPNSKIFSIAKNKNFNEFEIDDQMKVKDVKSIFLNNLGLEIQIYRKMGNNTVETTYTQEWTLAHQNNKGLEVF